MNAATDERAAQNRQRIEDALVSAGKRAALASEVGISEGHLSKMLGGELHRFCRILSVLGLEIHDAGFVASLERVLKAKL